jgi:hypothetical protein
MSGFQILRMVRLFYGGGLMGCLVMQLRLGLWFFGQVAAVVLMLNKAEFQGSQGFLGFGFFEFFQGFQGFQGVEGFEGFRGVDVFECLRRAQ